MKHSLTAVLLTGCAIVGAARATFAEDFWMLFQNHRVTLIARDLTVSQILDRWASVGGTTIVNADAVAGGPVTLRLIDVPEREALEILLRNADGYIVAEREDETGGASTIGRIQILRRTLNAASIDAPAPMVSVAAAIEQPSDNDVQPVVPSDVAPRAPGVSRDPRRNAEPADPNVARLSTVGGMPVVIPPNLPPGTFVGLGTITEGPGQAPKTVPMLLRQSTAATSRPGETAPPEPVTRLSSGPQQVPQQ